MTDPELIRMRDPQQSVRARMDAAKKERSVLDRLAALEDKIERLETEIVYLKSDLGT